MKPPAVADSAPEPLGGRLQVRPGLARPFNLVSTRPDWVHQLTHGKSAAAAPDLLATVFNLCGQAHRLCATLALQAASGNTGPLNAAASRQLHTETRREHLRRITLDWPLQLAASADPQTAFQQAALATYQMLQADVLTRKASQPTAPAPEDAALPGWLETHWLGVPPRQWLARWDEAPHDWLRHWCAATPGWLPELLAHAQSAADSPMAAPRPLQVHAAPQALMALAGELQASAAFTRQPHWQQQSAETGPWTRLNQPHPEMFNTAWLRLGARLAELVRLSLPGDSDSDDGSGHSSAQWLQSGSLAIGENAGLAWVEMARGLLIHFIQTDGPGAGATIRRCRVLAPTEWNFHPEGAVAQQLETLPARLTPDNAQHIRALMTAFDPCVRFDLPPLA